MYSPKTVKWMTVTVAIVALIVAVCAQMQADARPHTARGPEQIPSLPHPAFLKHAVFGYQQVVSDILWLQAIQAIGGGKIVSGAEWIYRTLDLATDLDPKFTYAYQLGGIVLSAGGNRLPLSNALLRKGARHNPETWQIPFYLGFNAYFYEHDYRAAALYMGAAARLPGRPGFLPGFAARLYVKAGDPRLGVALLQAMINETQDETIRASLTARRDAILADQIKGLARDNETAP
jgi:hypothetical protein